MLHTQARVNPYHAASDAATIAEDAMSVQSKTLTVNEANELVNRLSQRKALPRGSQADVAKAGGATSHVTSF